MRGKVFRLAHMGYVDTFDVVTMVSAVEIVLHHLGYPFEWGAGVRAAQEVLGKPLLTHARLAPGPTPQYNGGDIGETYSGQ